MGWLWWTLIIPIVDLVVLSRLARLGGGGVAIWLAAAALLGFLVIRHRGSPLLGGAPKESPLGFLDRGLLLLAGILLIFPGPLSDGIALLLLVPSVRRRLLERLRSSFAGRRMQGGGPFSGFTWSMGSPPRGAGSPPDPGQPGGEAGDRGPRSGVHSSYPGADGARDVEWKEVDRKSGSL